MIAPPQFLTQARLHEPERGQKGTCLAACLAMVIGCEESEVPTRYLEVAESRWWMTLEEDLAAMGWTIRYVPDPEASEPRGWHIVNGPSPRGVSHSCLGYRGTLIWDPHPSRSGLIQVDSYYVLVPLAATGGAA